MEINRRHLKDATALGLLDESQAERLWAFLSEQAQQVPSFRFTHILYYLGGMIAIGAMTLFMNLGWEQFGGWGVFVITLAYAGAGLCLTEYFLRRRQLAIPAGITATFVVVLIPLAVFSLQTAMNWWPGETIYREYHQYVSWKWLMMELATLAGGAVMLWRYRLPFLVMPIAVTLWYMSMDLTPILFGSLDYSWELRKFVSLWFGLLTLLLAFWVDIRTRQSRDYAFWLYLFGVIAFWGGLSMMSSDNELSKFLYFCINLAMIGIGAILTRRVFAIFGGLGAAGYLGYLAHNVFKGSVIFPFALTFIGLGIIYLGILWQRHESRLGHKLRSLLPEPLRVLVERGQ